MHSLPTKTLDFSVKNCYCEKEHLLIQEINANLFKLVNEQLLDCNGFIV